MQAIPVCHDLVQEKGSAEKGVSAVVQTWSSLPLSLFAQTELPANHNH